MAGEGVDPDAALLPLVVEYCSEWTEQALVLIAQLRTLLGSRARRIEHIGSTSIPGMAAKDVIDIQISVGDLAQAADAFERPLGELGFRRSPYDRDHVPAGVADDPGRWAKRLWVRGGGPDCAVNLHVRLVGSPNERMALLFRDWFRSHPEAIPAYAAFKRCVAAISPDTGTYAQVKDPVVDLVVAVAERWAVSTGWTSVR